MSEADRNESRIKDLNELLRRLEGSGLQEYVELSRNKRKLLFWNFLTGIARGLGFAIGTTIVLAILYKVISELISMNIPYLTEMLQDFIAMVKSE